MRIGGYFAALAAILVAGNCHAAPAIATPLPYSSPLSITAIGAPNDFEGVGRVYLYESADAANYFQALEPDSGVDAVGFGTDVRFINDINSDGLADLVVGAPGMPGVAEGGVYAFLSAKSGVVVSGVTVGYTVSYTGCGVIQGPVGFGEKIELASGDPSANSASILVYNPLGARQDNFLVSFQPDANLSTPVAAPLNSSCRFSLLVNAGSVTVAPTSTATPTPIATLTPTLTVSPVVTTKIPDPIQLVGFPIAAGLIPTVIPTVAPTVVFEPTPPIVVAPDYGGLPAPQFTVSEGMVQVALPVVRPQFSLEQKVRLIRKLQKERGLSRTRADRLLNDSSNLLVTYIITYAEVTKTKASRFAFIQSAHADDASRVSSKARQLRTRRNSITLRNLRPGASYSLSYRVEISTRTPRAVLGVTKPSAAVVFQVGE